MKKLLLIIAAIALIGITGSSLLSRAEDKAAPKFEYAIVKYEGPDLLLFNLPGRFELEHLTEQGIPIPKNAENEEFCLASACNIMAKSGWEPVNLDGNRIVFHRLMPK